MVRGTSQPAVCPVLLLLVAANIPLRLYAPRLALSQGDLIVFYGMQAVMCAMASEWIDVIHPYIYSYGIFHHPETELYVLPYVSDWLFFKTDRGPLEGFNFGGKSLSYYWAHLGPWWPKILACWGSSAPKRSGRRTRCSTTTS